MGLTTKRRALYSRIATCALAQEFVKQRMNVNYTNVADDVLEGLINDFYKGHLVLDDGTIVTHNVAQEHYGWAQTVFA